MGSRPPIIEPQLILLIEDDPDAADITEHFTAQLWPEAVIYRVSNLTEALTALAAHTPHIVIADLLLNDSRPERTLETLLQALPYQTVLFVVSGAVSRLEGQAAIASGADGFFCKGIPHTTFQHLVLQAWLVRQGQRARRNRQRKMRRQREHVELH